MLYAEYHAEEDYRSICKRRCGVLILYHPPPQQKREENMYGLNEKPLPYALQDSPPPSHLPFSDLS